MPIVGTTLRLHFEPTQERIWLAAKDGAVATCDFNPESIAAVLEGVDEVRLFGTRLNADLICWLYQARSDSGYSFNIQLGTPGVCRQADLADPMKALSKIGDLHGRVPSQGGLHDMNKHDFTTYLLICALKRSGGKLTEDIENLLTLHPAWPAISFIPSLDLLATAKMLSHVVDPRWYVNPRFPDRSSNLKARLGLVLQNMLHYTQDAKGSINKGSALNVLRAWANKAEASHPAAFLQRCQYRQDTPEKGLLRASHLFARFISGVWLQSMETQTELFVPEYFFAGDDDEFRDETVAMYKRHAAENNI